MTREEAIRKVEELIEEVKANKSAIEHMVTLAEMHEYNFEIEGDYVKYLLYFYLYEGFEEEKERAIEHLIEWF